MPCNLQIICYNEGQMASFFMTDLIDRDDPQFFEQTSDIPYDRHSL